METEEEEALMVKVFESFVGDEPFHSSNVNKVLLLLGSTDSMPRWMCVHFADREENSEWVKWQTLMTYFAGCYC